MLISLIKPTSLLSPQAPSLFHLPPHASLATLNPKLQCSLQWIGQTQHLTSDQQRDRLLLVMQGTGLTINGHPYGLYEHAYLPAQQTASCELEKKPVTLLSLAFDPNQLQANMRVLSLSFPLHFNLTSHYHYLCYLLSGRLTIDDMTLNKGHAIMISEQDTLQLSCQKKVELAFITLKPLTSPPSSS